MRTDPSSLSDFPRGMRCRQTGMDARRAALAMVVPLPSGATPQTPGLAATLRDGSQFGASRRCASSLGDRQSFVGAPCAASELISVAPTRKARQAARHEPGRRWFGRQDLTQFDGTLAQAWHAFVRLLAIRQVALTGVPIYRTPADGPSNQIDPKALPEAFHRVTVRVRTTRPGPMPSLVS